MGPWKGWTPQFVGGRWYGVYFQDRTRTDGYGGSEARRVTTGHVDDGRFENEWVGMGAVATDAKHLPWMCVSIGVVNLLVRMGESQIT